MVHKTNKQWVEMEKSETVRVVLTVEYAHISDYLDAIEDLQDEAMTGGSLIDIKTLVESYAI